MATLLTFLLSVALAAPVPDPEPWLDAVVLLTTGASICAGVVVDGRGTVATAYHCVASGRRPRVETRGGPSGLGRLVAASPRDDLALLEVPELAGQPALPIRERDVAAGERVWALGHPYGSSGSPLFEGLLRWSVSSGIVSAVGARLIQVDAPMNPGNSGGPLVDERGRVAGIASRKLRADNVAFMAPASRLRALLDEPEEPRLIGGGLAPALSLSIPSPADSAAALGGGVELWLRDRVGLSGAAYAPLGARWLALQRGSVRWTSSELRLSCRLRVGRGALSTTAELGGGVAFISGLSGSIEGEQLRLASAPPAPAPVLGGRVTLSGVGLRYGLIPSGEGIEVWAAIDLLPGTAFVF